MQNFTLGIAASGPWFTPVWQTSHCNPRARWTLCGKAIGCVGWAGCRFKKSLMAARTLSWEGEKTPVDWGERLDVPEDVAGTASITIHPLAHISATISQILKLVRARIFARRECVAPFPPGGKRKSLQQSG